MSKSYFINGRFLTQATTGVQRFALEICKELSGTDLNFKILTPHTARVIPKVLMPHVQLIGKGLSGYPWEQYSLPNWLKKQNSPLLLNLCNTAPLIYSNKIVTIHDLAFLQHPEWFSFKFRTVYNFMIPKIAQSSKMVLTVSETIKKELINSFNLDSGKVQVIPNGLPENFINTVGKVASKFDRPYILAFGKNNPRKNTTTVIRSMQSGLHKTHDLRIVNQGEENFSGNAFEKENWIFYHNPNDDELIQLYKGAKVLAYPSLYEGFGIPPLEAISCDCPVILSNIEVFRELYSGNAIFVDPLSVNEIESAIKEIVNRGFAWQKEGIAELMAKYNYEKSAQRILDFLGVIN